MIKKCEKRECIYRPIEVISIIVTAAAVFYGFYIANQLTWLSTIENRSLEFEKLAIVDKDISCIYLYKNQDLNQACEENHRDINALRKNVLYAESLIELFKDVENYDKEYRLNTFEEDYSFWVIELFESKYFQQNILDELNDRKIAYVKEKIKELNIECELDD